MVVSRWRRLAGWLGVGQGAVESDQKENKKQNSTLRRSELPLRDGLT